jgi:hypothetical protein
MHKLQVTLNQDDLAEMREAAERSHLKLATWARVTLLRAARQIAREAGK